MKHSTLQPYDQFNQELERNVHPADWCNPQPPAKGYQMVVIGAGTAGLVTAAGAAGLGARVALIERELMGGDCLNVGCVPSKAVIRAGHVVHQVRQASEFGVDIEGSIQVDFARTMERMRRLRASISPADSAARFSGLGVDVYFGTARFKDDRTIEVTPGEATSGNGAPIELGFRTAVIASGARPAAPPIPGLESVPYLTHQTVFSLTELPSSLAIIGGGPIGVEMAQAFARLGSRVTLLEMADQILIREDPDAARIVQRQLIADGVRFVMGSQIRRVEMADDSGGDATIRIATAGRDGDDQIRVSTLLVAAGRAANVDGLNLQAVGVDYDRRGVRVDDRMRTTHPRIYAAGDVASRYQFTHAADFMARIVIQNALFRLGPLGARKANGLVIPWCTYTEPEIAHVGMYARQAEEAGIDVDTYVQPLDAVDRAILDGRDQGFVKIHVRKGTDRIVGATIVGNHAGDLISEITLALQHRIGLGKIGSTIHPYPTVADAIRRVGDQYNRTRLTPWAKRLLGGLLWWNVGR